MTFRRSNLLPRQKNWHNNDEAKQTLIKPDFRWRLTKYKEQQSWFPILFNDSVYSIHFWDHFELMKGQCHLFEAHRKHSGHTLSKMRFPSCNSQRTMSTKGWYSSSIPIPSWSTLHQPVGVFNGVSASGQRCYIVGDQPQYLAFIIRSNHQAPALPTSKQKRHNTHKTYPKTSYCIPESSKSRGAEGGQPPLPRHSPLNATRISVFRNPSEDIYHFVL